MVRQLLKAKISVIQMSLNLHYPCLLMAKIYTSYIVSTYPCLLKALVGSVHTTTVQLPDHVPHTALAITKLSEGLHSSQQVTSSVATITLYQMQRADIAITTFKYTHAQPIKYTNPNLTLTYLTLLARKKRTTFKNNGMFSSVFTVESSEKW